ncbi:MAG: gndA 1 [Oscillospiraceae bacterium]|nr:gndA 1 [Oscillospiraceae bacterium]
MSSQMGVVGLSVMGRGLALNMAQHGFSVIGYNLEPEYTDAFVKIGKTAGYRVDGAFSYQELSAALERPRKILVMVKAGKPVDLVLDGLLPHLDIGDIIIDGGNSFYEDTRLRCERCAEQGVYFMGMGVSGGEEGARNGPALMPGGDRAAYAQVAPFLTAIAARVGVDSCCTYIGPDGAGHFVKMVHNGIEYGDMQLICEAYYLMKRLLGMSASEIAAVFRCWNQGELSSYLLEITTHILEATDPETGKPMVDVILGEAGSKGTGMWTAQEALALGVPIPTIVQSVFSRYLSVCSQHRKIAAATYTKPAVVWQGGREETIEDIRRAFYNSRLCSYAQGFDLLQCASEANDWSLDLGGIALLFRGGCIIRAAFLNDIAAHFRESETTYSLLNSNKFSAQIEAYQPSWRRVVAAAAECGIAVPAFSSSLSYFDGFCDPEGPLNLLQAQRDCFGAHTFRRIDRQGTFHREW